MQLSSLYNLRRSEVCSVLCRNVLLSRFGEAKVADVGFSKVMHRDCLSLRSGLGTFDYAAPEVLLGESSNEKADIYRQAIVCCQD